MKQFKGLELMEYIAKRGLVLTFYCERGEQVSKKGECVCHCENSTQVAARAKKKKILKNFQKTGNYKLI